MEADTYSALALADDSGLFSCSSETEESTNHSMEEEASPGGSLLLVTQELHKTRSQLERLSKSEQWYKQELQMQKHTRLETLERLYAQERKYMLENQRLQQESRQLEKKCNQLEINKQGATELQPIQANESVDSLDSCSFASSFEAQEQQTRLTDQNQLIELLRKQKKQLLLDIQHQCLEHDDKQLDLQRQLAGMEVENRHMTRQCKQLLDEQRQLTHQLKLKAESLQGVTAEREQLRQVIAELNETLQTQEKLLALKEREFLDIKQHYQAKINSDCSIDAMHNYSLAFHEEIHAKTSEIAQLKLALHELQTELLVMSQLQEKNEAQQQQLVKLNFKLEAQQLEQALKDEQLQNAAGEKEGLATQLQDTQQALHQLEQQLLELQQQLDKQQRQNKEQEQQLKTLEETEGKCNKSEANNRLLEERVRVLEEELVSVMLKRQKTVELLQRLLQQQNDKIKNTREMEADWIQVLEALQITQKMEHQLQQQLQEKNEELEHLTELFDEQNLQLHHLQLLSLEHEEQNINKFQQLKKAQAADAASVNKMRGQVLTLELAPRQQHKAMVQLLELATGRKLQHVKNWQQLIKMMRQEMRSARAASELPALRAKLLKISQKHERAVERIKRLERNLAMERARFETSDSGKSTARSTPVEPENEEEILFDDDEKPIQEPAEEPGRLKHSHILDLIKRSHSCEPNLRELTEGLAACREDMQNLNKLLAAPEPAEEQPAPMPSLMEEMRDAEQN